MFNDTYLINHLDYNQSIKVEPGCFMEINQNDQENIRIAGVFKYGDFTETQIRKWNESTAYYWPHKNVLTELQNAKYDLNDHAFFGIRKKSDYFSLADCFGEFRPRSGINKLVQPVGPGKTYIDDFKSVRRPRYYAPAVEDRFKYWTSWNTDIGPRVGLSDSSGRIKYAAPFVVYDTPVAANKISVKIQTGMGETVKTKSTRLSKGDKLNQLSLSTIPKKWRIQYLDMYDTWQTAMAFDNYSEKYFHSYDGALDLVMTVNNPSESKWPNFTFKGYLPTTSHLPLTGRDGEAFCIGRDTKNLGWLYIWLDDRWQNSGKMDYKWRIADPTMNPEDYAVKDFVDPLFYNPTVQPIQRSGGDAYDFYSGFVFLKGLRILVDTMVARDKPFELIELSPRLFANVTNMVESYNIDKAIAAEDSVLPVGGLSISNGSVTLSNIDLALNREMKYNMTTRKGSILAGRIRNGTKFLFYEIVREVPVEGVLYDKFIPVKTLYAVDRPQAISGSEGVNVVLRDLNYRFEEAKCPNLMLKSCSLTKAVATILDYVGFTNYIFHMDNRNTWTETDKKTKSDTSPLDTIFPYFFCSETQTVAEVLDQLSIASQCAMFFDEYNNLVIMPREHFNSKSQYVLRDTNRSTDAKYPNIEDIDIAESTIADAEITYTIRDLARGNLPLREVGESGTRDPGEAGNVMAYKPAEVWNVTQSEQTTLSAAPLNTFLSNKRPSLNPSVRGGIANNTFDLGIYAQYYPFSGMLLMNGEIIEFDAKEYAINGGTVWVDSQTHLDEVIGRSSFTRPDGSGQMIYPTGKMRIKTTLTMNDQKVVSIASDGRGRLGTTITEHSAEPSDWLTSHTYKFTDTALGTLYGKIAPTPTYTLGKYFDGTADNIVRATHNSTSNYIYNSLHSKNAIMKQSPMTITPAQVATLSKERRIMRSSALTFAGAPNGTANDVYYKTKVIEGGHYNLFGARIGIIGTQFSAEGESINQKANGALTLATYKLAGDTTTYNVDGAGGGLMFWSNRHVTAGSQTSNDAYYFEILALGQSYNITNDEDNEQVVFANVNFYKINRGKHNNGAAQNVPVKLFSTYADILVTSGSQTVRDRTIPSDQTTIYDLAVEVSSIGTLNSYQRIFHLYINDILIGTVTEPVGGPGYFVEKSTTKTELGIFARGRSEIQVEHLYAVGTQSVDPSPIFVDQKVMSRPRSFKVFSPSALYAASFLDGGKSQNSIYFEEFGSIAREVRDIRAPFDMYPIALSTIAKQAVFDRSYTVSGYFADSYKARFMLFSQADRLIDLGQDETNLSILGLPFQNNEPVTMTIDDYLMGNYDGAANVSRDLGNNLRKDLLAARAAGSTEKISFESLYIQSTTYVINMMRWLSGFMGKSRTELTVKAFGVPHIQLGDIVTIDYNIPSHVDDPVPATKGELTPLTPAFTQPTTRFYHSSANTPFMVQSISIERDLDGPDYTLRLIQLPPIAVWKAGDF